MRRSCLLTDFEPVVRLEDFHVGHEERFGVLELRVQARHGGEKLEILFPADRERAIGVEIAEREDSCRVGDLARRQSNLSSVYTPNFSCIFHSHIFLAFRQCAEIRGALELRSRTSDDSNGGK